MGLVDPISLVITYAQIHCPIAINMRVTLNPISFSLLNSNVDINNLSPGMTIQ